jgi:beta-lactamase regulating signal transducer with metallopeptidase domain
LLMIVLLKFVTPPFLFSPVGLFSQFQISQTETANDKENMDNSYYSILFGNRNSGKQGMNEFMVNGILKSEADLSTEKKEAEILVESSGNHATKKPKLTWFLVSISSYLLLVWFAGFVLSSLWLLRLKFKLIQLAQNAKLMSNTYLNKNMEQYCSQMNIKRIPRILVSSEISIPFTTGVISPKIFLPKKTCKLLTKEQINIVLMHELAHQKRGDLWVNSIQNVMFTLWWFHPVYWLLNRSIQSVREESCDDYIISHQFSTQEVYCETLLHVARNAVARSMPRQLVSMAHSKNSLTSRINRLMENKMSYTFSYKNLLALILLGIILIPGLNAEQIISNPESTVRNENSSDSSNKINSVTNIASSNINKGIELFIHSCQTSALNPSFFRTGYGEYKLIITTPTLSEEKIQAQIELHNKMNREIMKKTKNEKVLNSLKKALSQVPELVRARNTGKKDIRVKILFDAKNPNKKIRSEFSMYDSVTKKWGSTITLDQRQGSITLDQKQGSNVQWEVSSRMVVLSKMDSYLHPFHPLGRIQGNLARISTGNMLKGIDLNNLTEQIDFSPKAVRSFKRQAAQLNKNTQQELYVLSGEAKYDKNAVASVIENRIKSKKGTIVAQRYWIDATRGFICPLIQQFDTSTGKISEEWKSKDYFLHSGSGLWFPAYFIHTEYSHGAEKFTKREEIWIDKTTLQLNQNISDEQFSVEVPKGTSIVDARTSEQKNYNANKSVTFSLTKDGLNLSKLLGK